MLKMPSQINPEYFREYRKLLGFSNQNHVKEFFQAKDIPVSVDYSYIELLNSRLLWIVEKINWITHPSIWLSSLESFDETYINGAYRVIRESWVILRLNNQWRRIEDVYFSWMRWYIISCFFTKALGCIFNIDSNNIRVIWEDDLWNIDTFRRSPKADIEVKIPSWKIIRIEMQSWFTGINDIKQHKVNEAKKIYEEYWYETIVIHFDIFNGQVWFVKIHDISDTDQNWITRQQMEGQTVFQIDQNFFLWKLIEKPLSYEELLISLDA